MRVPTFLSFIELLKIYIILESRSNDHLTRYWLGIIGYAIEMELDFDEIYEEWRTVSDLTENDDINLEDMVEDYLNLQMGKLDDNQELYAIAGLSINIMEHVKIRESINGLEITIYDKAKNRYLQKELIN